MGIHTVVAVLARMLLLFAFCAAAHAFDLPRAGTPCDQIPQPERWIDAGTPDFLEGAVDLPEPLADPRVVRLSP